MNGDGFKLYFRERRGIAWRIVFSAETSMQCTAFMVASKLTGGEWLTIAGGRDPNRDKIEQQLRQPVRRSA